MIFFGFCLFNFFVVFKAFSLVFLGTLQCLNVEVLKKQLNGFHDKKSTYKSNTYLFDDHAW